MNILAAFVGVFVWAPILQCCANKPYKSLDPESLLMEMQEKALKDHRLRKNKEFIVDIAPVSTLNPIDLLQALQGVDKRYFILFWISNGRSSVKFSEARYGTQIEETGRRGNQGTKIFQAMQENYKIFLYQKLFSFEGDKDALFFEAMQLYYEKFHSIWRGLVGDKKAKFDMMDQEFLFCQTAMNDNVELLLEIEFSNLFKSIDKGDDKAIAKYQKHFYILVQSLSTNKSKKYGLEWVANIPNSLLTLFFFNYLELGPDWGPNIRCFKEFHVTRKAVYGNAIFALKKIMNYTFYLRYHELVLTPSFKSPFPQLFTDKEMRAIIIKILYKFLGTFDYSEYFSDRDLLLKYI